MQRRSFVIQGLSSLTLSLAAPSTAFSLAQVAAKTPITDTDITALTKQITSAIYLPGTPEYAKLRHAYAAKVDLHPALIIHPLNAADVSKAVTFARTHSLPLAVRCGGHSYAGYNTCEGGLVIDLSGLRDITISPDKTSVRAGGGVLCGPLEIATAKEGRAAALGQCPSVGIGGFLLGGGVGPLMGKYGLGCDNVLSVDVVLADGRAVTASAHENPDLFWATRGGGGNFGVVTSFTIALHPVSQVFAGYMTFAGASMPELLRIFRDFAALATDELSLIATLSPGRKGNLVLNVQACFLGDEESGKKLLAPMKASKLLVDDTVKLQPYLTLEQQVPFDIPPQRCENRGGFFPELTDAVIDSLTASAASAPGFYEYSFIPLHGAVTRVPANAMAFPLRSKGFAIGVMSKWKTDDGPQKSSAWATATSQKVAPLINGNYINVMDRESEANVRSAFAANYQRLATLKAKYDPTNLFSINQNIKPARRT